MNSGLKPSSFHSDALADCILQIKNRIQTRTHEHQDYELRKTEIRVKEKYFLQQNNPCFNPFDQHHSQRSQNQHPIRSETTSLNLIERKHLYKLPQLSRNEENNLDQNNQPTPKLKQTKKTKPKTQAIQS
jgi:hypothetical protein